MDIRAFPLNCRLLLYSSLLCSVVSTKIPWRIRQRYSISFGMISYKATLTAPTEWELPSSLMVTSSKDDLTFVALSLSTVAFDLDERTGVASVLLSNRAPKSRRCPFGLRKSGYESSDPEQMPRSELILVVSSSGHRQGRTSFRSVYTYVKVPATSC